VTGCTLALDLGPAFRQSGSFTAVAVGGSCVDFLTISETNIDIAGELNRVVGISLTDAHTVDCSRSAMSLRSKNNTLNSVSGMASDGVTNGLVLDSLIELTLNQPSPGVILRNKNDIRIADSTVIQMNLPFNLALRGTLVGPSTLLSERILAKKKK
nr:hypothetical protein [Candidatus Dependentiae bacterium]